jgi:hypothetical protein
VIKGIPKFTNCFNCVNIKINLIVALTTIIRGINPVSLVFVSPDLDRSSEVNYYILYTLRLRRPPKILN